MQAVAAAGSFIASNWVAIAAVTASAASAYSSIQGGRAAAASYAAQARSHENEARQADLQARQVSALRLRELNANLAAIEAARAGKNLIGDSPTQAAIIKSFTRESLGARANEISEATLRGISANNAAAAAGLQGQYAKQAGYLGAVGDVADIGMRLSKLVIRPRPRTPTTRPRTGGTSGSPTRGPL